MTDDAVPSENSPSGTTDQPGQEQLWLGWSRRIWSRLNASLSRVHSVVGLAAGILSILGAVVSASQFFKPAPGTGEVLAIVQEARSQRGVSGATIEILTPRNEVVTTLSPDSLGRARAALQPGPYRLRASHPRFGAEVRSIHVRAGQTGEVHLRLRAGASSPLTQAGRAVSEGVGSFRRMLGL